MNFTISLLFFPIIIILFSFLLSMKNSSTREKQSPFECGFDPVFNSRIPFSLRFFLLMVLFLIFDIEIVLILPLPYILSSLPIYNFFMPMLSFIFIIILGLLHEWKEGSLDWSN